MTPLNKTQRDQIEGFAAGMGLAALSTGIAVLFHFNLSAATSLNLFFVILLAIRWGILQASIASILSIACLDYFFTEPRFAFTMVDPRDWVALFIFEIVALLTSRISVKVRMHASDADKQRARLEMLYDLSQCILLLNRQTRVEPQLVRLLQVTLHLDGVALWDAFEVQFFQTGGFPLSEEELRSIYYGDAEHDDPNRQISLRVLRVGARPIGAIGFCGSTLDAKSVDAAASLIAIALERSRSFQAESQAAAAQESEQLRATVLDALAHAYKTPLATIRSSSSGLLEIGTLSEVQKELVSLIDEEAEHLHQITDTLLRTAELDRANLKINRHELNLAELVSDLAQQTIRSDQNTDIQLSIPAEDIAIMGDIHLLRMVLEQLLDNARKYKSPQTTIQIALGGGEESEAVLSIHNYGCLIPPEERQRIFVRFYRGSGTAHRASGTGIGLSVAKKIVDAHRGRIWVESDQTLGTTFFVSLPRMAKES